MNLESNDGELVVVETLRQEICFSALTLRASSKSFSIDPSDNVLEDRRLILLYFFVSHMILKFPITKSLFFIQMAAADLYKLFILPCQINLSKREGY